MYKRIPPAGQHATRNARVLEGLFYNNLPSCSPISRIRIEVHAACEN